jgi:anhydro-N-acetylmuramic acid kinase
MSERPSLVVGLMSGTSLDGMDAALVRFRSPTDAELVDFAHLPYDAAERRRLADAIGGGSPRELALLHVELAEWAAEAVQVVLEGAQVPASELGGIGFPGQTIWHEPPKVTWQLGEPAVLAERFGVKVVSNFRARDLAAGGQGAPLVPMADVLLFGAAAEPRVLVNIGGMANLTYVPRRAVEDGAFAFDTGPGVAIVDAVARLVDPSLPCDLDGQIAARGSPREEVLAELLADPFFAAAPPKSTGRELFGDEFARRLHERVPGPDGVATAVALTARSLGGAIRRWVRGRPEVVVAGGGRRHPGILASLTRELRDGDRSRVRLFDDLFFDGDAKEAVAFALLAYLTLHGQPGNLPAATGAAGARVLGSVTPA